MASWTSDELAVLAAEDEVLIASARADGSLRKPVIVWMVVLGDRVFVRSVNGRTAAWFRGTEERHEGRVRSGSVDRAIEFVDAETPFAGELDALYRTKYRRERKADVDSIVTPLARAATLELVPC